MIVGYARVSTQEQNLDRQIDNLKAYGAEVIYEEKLTGTGLIEKRPQFSAMKKALREGDTLVVDSFSRLSRSTKELLNTVEWMRKKKISLVSLKENVDANTASGKLMMSLFSILSEFERDLLSERTKEGLEAAKKRGRNGGRKYAAPEEKRNALVKAYEEGGLTASEAAEAIGINVRTFRRWVSEKRNGINSKK